MTAMLVFSLINLICCNPLFGIVALVFTILSQFTDSYKESAQRLKIAMILNIVGVCLMIVILFFFLLIVMTDSFVEWYFIYS